MAKHSNVKDDGAVFVIVPNTRKVIVPTSHYVIGTVGEHLSEQITFECPTTIDGHDITGCGRKYVTWQSVDGTVGHDGLEDMTVNGNVARFKWNVRNGLTTAKGVVSFSVHFEDVVKETVAGKIVDKTVYKFSTTTCKSCEILDTVNAMLGAYEAICVTDETLVIADYNAVTDSTLKIDSNAIIPHGSIEITANGSYDVGKYAMANVFIESAKPSVTVNEEGVVTAMTPADTTIHQLSASDDPDFIAENIKSGVKILGVSGRCPSVEYVQGTISNQLPNKVLIRHMGVGTDGTVNPRFVEAEISNEVVFGVVKDSLFMLSHRPSAMHTILVEFEGEVEMYPEADATCSIVRPKGNGFKITISENKQEIILP